MRQRIRRVVKLFQRNRAGNGVSQQTSLFFRAQHPLFSRRVDDFRPQRPHENLFLFGKLGRHDENNPIPPIQRSERDSQTGVAGGSFDDRAAGL